VSIRGRYLSWRSKAAYVRSVAKAVIDRTIPPENSSINCGAGDASGNLLGLVIVNHRSGCLRPAYLDQNAFKAVLKALVAAEWALDNPEGLMEERALEMASTHSHIRLALACVFCFLSTNRTARDGFVRPPSRQAPVSDVGAFPRPGAFAPPDSPVIGRWFDTL
jgi:hypothetical protein